MNRTDKYKYYYKQVTKPVTLVALIIGFFGVLLGALGLFIAVRYSQLNTQLLSQQQQIAPPVRLVAEGEVTSPLGNGKAFPLTYQVKAGDSLWKISEQLYGHGCYYQHIAMENNLLNPNQIAVGMELVIPSLPQDEQVIGLNEVLQQDSSNKILKLSDSIVKSNDQSILASENARENSEHFVYQVEAGDTLWFIALKYYGDGYRWSEIYQANKVVIGNNPDLIYPEARLDL